MWNPRNWPGMRSPGRQPLGPRRHPDALSARECATLERLARGDTHAEIATALGLELSTVRTFVRRAYEKLGAHNRVRAVARHERAHPHCRTQRDRPEA